MKTKLLSIWSLLTDTVKEWNKDHAAQLAAAIAYYTIFSIPPLLIIALDIAGRFYDSNKVQGQLITQLGNFIGAQTADFIKSLLVNSTQFSSLSLTSLISIVVLLVGASGVFNQIQFALNIIWDVPPKQGRNLARLLKYRLLSFLLVLAIGFLFLVFLALSAVIPVVVGAQNSPFVEAINFIVQFIILMVLLAMVFRIIPDKEINWADVWLGSAVTALLFILGRYAIGLYLSYSKSASAFGAAGSLIVMLLWIYYSAQIFLLGAEFTQVYARKFGSRKAIEANAAPDREMAPVRQSLHPQE